MNTVARKLRFAASPMVLAVALGLLAPAALIEDDAAPSRPGQLSPDDNDASSADDISTLLDELGA